MNFHTTASNVRQIRDQLKKTKSSEIVLDDASQEGSIGCEYGSILVKPISLEEKQSISFRSRQKKTGSKTLPEDQASESSVSSTFLTESTKVKAFSGIKESKLAAQEELEDIDIEEVETLAPPLVECSRPTSSFKKLINSKPIEIPTARELRRLLLKNSSTCWSPDWTDQDLTFSSQSKLSYGIIQRKGGPCGVLAAIQAWLLHYLLFSQSQVDEIRSEKLKNFKTIKRSLIKAIAHMIWSAGECRTGSLCIKGKISHFPSTVNLPHDGITEKLNIYLCKELDQLESCLENNIESLTSKGGIICIVYSIILSRSIRTVKRDMDELDKCLIVSHNYCSQELVNLMLTGRACSNTFNDTKNLDELILKGIDQRQTIGMLSLFDHYRSTEVGSYLKTPKSPIWVICSESHYSVLFSTNKALINDWKAERLFDLLYYDGLSNQLDEIRLSVITTEKGYVPPEKESEELVPPLELCIRTKWKDARVEWNNTTPIL